MRHFKRKISIMTLAAYAALTHYCLVYAVVTGNMHHATAIFDDLRLPDNEGREAHHPSSCHSTQADGDSSSRRNDSQSKQDDPCCITIFQNVPGIVSGGEASPNSPALVLLPVKLSGDAFSPAPEPIFYQEERGPPTPAAQPSFFSRQNPRAPPLASL